MKKIVLTANDDRGLDGEMAMHFGHCSHFVLAHVDADTWWLLVAWGARPSSFSGSSASKSPPAPVAGLPRLWMPISLVLSLASPSAITPTDLPL